MAYNKVAIKSFIYNYSKGLDRSISAVIRARVAHSLNHQKVHKLKKKGKENTPLHTPHLLHSVSRSRVKRTLLCAALAPTHQATRSKIFYNGEHIVCTLHIWSYWRFNTGVTIVNSGGA